MEGGVSLKFDEFLKKPFEENSYFAVTQHFLQEKHEELSPYSIKHLYASLYPLGVDLDNPSLATITYKHLRDYVDALWLRYKPGTIKPIIGDIKQLFRWAKKRKYAKRNPAKRLRKPSKRSITRSARPKAAPETAVRQLLSYLVKKLNHCAYRDVFGKLYVEAVDCWTYEERIAARDLFIIAFLYETGARVGELRRLGTRAMDGACTEFHQVYNVTSVGKTDDHVLWFTHATAEIWTVWRQVRPPEYQDYAVVSWQRNQPAKPMRRDTASRIIARRCQQAGILHPFRSHALRHAKIVRGQKLIGLELTSLLLEHSNVDMTRAYADANVEDDKLREAAALTGLPQSLFTI